MLNHISVTEDDYFLPEDGLAAQKRFLQVLKNFKEAWISAYSFTLQPMFTELKNADQRGARIHILLDHSQEGGKAEQSQVVDLAHGLKRGDVTITTAGINSKQPNAIWHWKAMVIDDGQKDPLCWEGSTNFSKTAWYQGNSARVFRSTPWAAEFKSQFAAHREWARQNEAPFQIK